MRQPDHAARIDRNTIAAEAGVSTATVSRVFNNPDSVSHERRQRVLAAAHRLGYAPNKFASALARKTTGRLLWLDGRKLSAHDPDNAAFYASLYTDALESALEVIAATTFHLEIGAPHAGSISPEEYDGILVFDIDNIQQAVKLAGSGVPLVCGHHVAHFPRGECFAVDNTAGGRLLAEHLAGLGHRRIAWVTGKTAEISSHRDRQNGIAGIFPDSQLQIIDGQLGPAGGAAAARQLLPEILAGKITAIIAVNDLTAFGLVQELRHRGVAIPAQVSVAACDNLPILQLLPMRLTTLDLQLPVLYRAAAERLLQIPAQPGLVQDSLRLFPPVLIPGDSTAVPAKS